MIPNSVCFFKNYKLWHHQVSAKDTLKNAVGWKMPNLINFEIVLFLLKVPTYITSLSLNRFTRSKSMIGMTPIRTWNEFRLSSKICRFNYATSTGFQKYRVFLEKFPYSKHNKMIEMSWRCLHWFNHQC